MKTATKTVQLPGLGLNAYEVDGRDYVSTSEIVQATRSSTSTDPLTKWLERGSNPSDAKGSQGFPQDFERGSFECNVPRPNGSTAVANLFRPAVAWHFILSELTNRSAAVRGRALSLVQVVGAAGFETMTQEALGLRVSVEENLTSAVRLQADLTSKAKPIQALKVAMYQALLPHAEIYTIYDLPRDDRYLPISKEIKEVINTVYTHLDEGIHSALGAVQKNTPHPKWKRPTKWSCLTEEAKEALLPVIRAYITAFNMIQAPATVLDIQRVIDNVSRTYPRYA